MDEACVPHPFWFFARLSDLLGICNITQISEGYAQLVAFLFAVVAGVFAYWSAVRRDRMIHMNEHTYSLISKNNPEILEILRSMQHKVFAPEPISIEDPWLKENRAKVHQVLTHFEHVGVAVKHGLASERYIMDTERTIFQSVFIALSPYIRSLRTPPTPAEGGRPRKGQGTACANFEAVFLRSKVKMASLICWPLDFTLFRTFLRLSRRMFRIWYWWTRIWHRDLPPDHLDSDWDTLPSKMNGVIFHTMLISTLFGLLTTLAVFDIITR